MNCHQMHLQSAISDKILLIPGMSFIVHCAGNTVMGVFLVRPILSIGHGRRCIYRAYEKLETDLTLIDASIPYQAINTV